MPKKSPGKTTRKTTPKKPAIKTKAAIKPPTPHPTDEEIAQAAYFRWLSRGGEHGDHEQDWFEAELELLEKKRAARVPRNRSPRKK